MDDLKDVDLYKDIVYKFSDHDDVRELPKVFLIQACRNSKGAPVCNGLEKPAGLRDLLVGHSTSPQLPAARNKKTGAVYIDIIDKVFRKSAQTLSLASLLYEVSVFRSVSLIKNQEPGCLIISVVCRCTPMTAWKSVNSIPQWSFLDFGNTDLSCDDGNFFILNHSICTPDSLYLLHISIRKMQQSQLNVFSQARAVEWEKQMSITAALLCNLIPLFTL